MSVNSSHWTRGSLSSSTTTASPLPGTASGSAKSRYRVRNQASRVLLAGVARPILGALGGSWLCPFLARITILSRAPWPTPWVASQNFRHTAWPRKVHWKHVVPCSSDCLATFLTASKTFCRRSPWDNLSKSILYCTKASFSNLVLQLPRLQQEMVGSSSLTEGGKLSSSEWSSASQPSSQTLGGSASSSESMA